MTKGMPVEVLESLASAQRRRLHNDVVELKSTMREKMDVRKNVRKSVEPYVLPASGVAAIIGVAFGYLVAGIFTEW